MILKGPLNRNYEHLLLVLFNTLNHDDFEKNNEVFTFKFLNSFLKVKIKEWEKVEHRTLLTLGYHFFPSVLCIHLYPVHSEAI